MNKWHFYTKMFYSSSQISEWPFLLLHKSLYITGYFKSSLHVKTSPGMLGYWLGVIGRRLLACNQHHCHQTRMQTFFHPSIHSFIHSFISNIYIACFKGNYSEALSTKARLKRTVLRREKNKRERYDLQGIQMMTQLACAWRSLRPKILRIKVSHDNKECDEKERDHW